MITKTPVINGLIAISHNVSALRFKKSVMTSTGPAGLPETRQGFWKHGKRHMNSGSPEVFGAQSKPPPDRLFQRSLKWGTPGNDQEK
jgi:hypothetical protein